MCQMNRVKIGALIAVGMYLGAFGVFYAAVAAWITATTVPTASEITLAIAARPAIIVAVFASPCLIFSWLSFKSVCNR
jgi:hypothetical protein